tara:strand:+ start:415 stop:663 length:249 start_codon:yes stop_codon:yes gene_type:complete
MFEDDLYPSSTDSSILSNLGINVGVTGIGVGVTISASTSGMLGVGTSVGMFAGVGILTGSLLLHPNDKKTAVMMIIEMTILN